MMNLLKTAGNLDDKIGELQYAAEKCNYMLENLCNTFGQIMDDKQKANNWDDAGLTADIAQDYSREMVETANEANKLVNQLFNEMKQNTIIILENKEVGRVPLQIKSIYYIESSKHYVIYHSEHNEPIKIRGNIGELEIHFSQYDFARIHKSFLVNLRHIFNIDRNKDEIIFKQGFRLNMSKNYKQTVDEKLTQYLRKTK